MAFITGQPIISNIDLYSSTDSIPGGLYVGQLIYGANGKAYRYSLVGASNLVMGNALQSSVIDTSYTNMAVATAITTANSTNQIAITNGTATITNDQFTGGSLSIYTAGTVAIGDEYTITGVTGVLTTGGALTVTVDRPFRAAITTSAKVNMRRSPWSGVIQSPASTLTGTPAGVAMFAATAAQYCWVQTHGVAGVLSDGSSILVGSEVAVPSATAGAVILSAAGLASVGFSMQAAASAHAIGVQLTID